MYLKEVVFGQTSTTGLQQGFPLGIETKISFDSTTNGWCLPAAVTKNFTAEILADTKDSYRFDHKYATCECRVAWELEDYNNTATSLALVRTDQEPLQQASRMVTRTGDFKLLGAFTHADQKYLPMEKGDGNTSNPLFDCGKGFSTQPSVYGSFPCIVRKNIAKGSADLVETQISDGRMHLTGILFCYKSRREILNSMSRSLGTNMEGSA